MRSRRKVDDGLTEKTLMYLATQKDIWAERRNSGSKLIPKKGGGFYKIWLGEPGTPDICGRMVTNSWPLPFGIETKAPTGKLRAAQKRWHDRAFKSGMPVLVARSLQDVVDFVAWLRGRREM